MASTQSTPIIMGSALIRFSSNRWISDFGFWIRETRSMKLTIFRQSKIQNLNSKIECCCDADWKGSVNVRSDAKRSSHSLSTQPPAPGVSFSPQEKQQKKEAGRLMTASL